MADPCRHSDLLIFLIFLKKGEDDNLQLNIMTKYLGENMYNKILTFGFDDCEIYDRNIAELFRKYGMKATFFLISDQLGLICPHHRYGEDTTVERVNAGGLATTYAGMEIASHTCNHYFPENDIEGTVLKSVDDLSKLCGYRVKGLAYPGGVYGENHIIALSGHDIAYARTAKSTHDFKLPKNFLAWDVTCSYDDPDMDELIEEFINYDGEEPVLFYIFGHSYELTRPEEKYNFTGFENILKRLAGREDIWYATNIEIAEKYRNK